MQTLRLLLLLMMVTPLVACPPTLNNGDDDDDATDATDDDDDDTGGGEDACCEGSGNAGTWEQCDDREAIECVCAIDNWCCGSGWDSGCVELYSAECLASCP